MPGLLRRNCTDPRSYRRACSLFVSRGKIDVGARLVFWSRPAAARQPEIRVRRLISRRRPAAATCQEPARGCPASVPVHRGASEGIAVDLGGDGGDPIRRAETAVATPVRPPPAEAAAGSAKTFPSRQATQARARPAQGRWGEAAGGAGPVGCRPPGRRSSRRPAGSCGARAGRVRIGRGRHDRGLARGRLGGCGPSARTG